MLKNINKTKKYSIILACLFAASCEPAMANGLKTQKQNTQQQNTVINSPIVNKDNPVEQQATEETVAGTENKLVKLASSKVVSTALTAGAAYAAHRGKTDTARVLAGLGAASNGLAWMDTSLTENERVASAISAVGGLYATTAKGKDLRNATLGMAVINAGNLASDYLLDSDSTNHTTPQAVSSPSSFLEQQNNKINEGLVDTVATTTKANS